MLIGMVANTMYQGTITGVTNLVEERENDFTAELFVAPISRYAVLLGKLIGSGIAALVSLVGIVAMIFVMQIPMNFGDLLRVIALAPILALAGGALGVLLHRHHAGPEGRRDRACRCSIFPQMFLSGALIPVAASTGILGFLAKIIPMTYSIDLARNIFYWGKPEYAAAVLHPLGAGPRGDGRVLPGLHDRRDVPVRSRRPQPIGNGPTQRIYPAVVGSYSFGWSPRSMSAVFAMMSRVSSTVFPFASAVRLRSS